MFHFFRKARQQELSEKAPGNMRPAGGYRRYLIYALGEILLVVIGILIALQVDNWNDERQQRQEALRFYANTRQQLLEDRNNIEGQIAYNNQHVGQFNYAIALIESDDRSAKDSLSSISGKLADYSDFDRQGNIYETIVNSGDVKLLKNDAIKKGLRRLEGTYLYINRMETIHYDAIMLMIPAISETINISSIEIMDEDRLFSGSFQNQFALALRIMEEKEQVYRRALDEIDRIIALIDEEVA